MLSYQAVIDALNLQKGDQITVVYATADDTDDGADGLFNGFLYGRFILEPNDGNMADNIFDSSKWNERNDNCKPYFAAQSGSNAPIATFVPTDIENYFNPNQAATTAAGAIIISRLVGDVWRRSSESLVIRPYTVGTPWHLKWDPMINLLSDAIASYMADTSSMLYLNQAEE